jgi:hypothetical protein
MIKHNKKINNDNNLRADGVYIFLTVHTVVIYLQLKIVDSTRKTRVRRNHVET